MSGKCRVGLMGCGTIGGYVLNQVISGKVDNTEIIIVCGRTNTSKGREKVSQLGIKWVTDPRAMIIEKPNVIIEAAAHEALEKYGIEILGAGIDLIPVSIGALVDAELLQRLKTAAKSAGSRLHIPSGGIGGLDAISAASHAGIKEVSMTSRKPPRAWKGIPYVEKMRLDLDSMEKPTLLYEGPARDCVKKFPQNINIAAALSLAGVGFGKTLIRIMADPTITHNIHEIKCDGETGRFSIVLENLPVPENPKTTFMACASTVATLRNLGSNYRMGT